jgi:shikimate kinase
VRAKSVVLVGFMGAGKSAVGRLLAKRLGFRFVETDEVISAREGRSIPEIFAEKGEPYFRALEAEALESLKTGRGDVIATGGGLPCREGAMEVLKDLGVVVWLSGEFETLYERGLRGGRRPMLENRSREEAETLYREREPYYRKADLTVDTAAMGKDAVVSRIVSWLGESRRRRRR